ncbi:conjugal transfer protein TrbL family protein (plasmid) [Clostridium tyrobutyricum]|uniref:conjugal transfer protein TrbL family protein n=1 Tax=Clostridium tyrobutyricum TaxID=1519 RepID=UPI0039F72C25
MFDIGDSVNKYLGDSIKDFLNSTFQAISKILFKQGAMPDFFNTLYSIFIGMGATVITIIVLYRIVEYMLQTSTGTNDTPLSEILLKTVKASAMIVIAPVLLKILVGEIAYPLGNWMFSQVAKNASSSAINFLSTGTLGGILGKGVVFLAVLAFVAIAVVVFFVKMCIYHAELIVYQVSSIWAAISMVSNNMDIMMEWWKGLLMMIISILMQTALIVGVTEIFTHTATWYNFMLLIGFCYLIIKGPDLLKRMWYGTGTSRGFMRLLAERFITKK